MKPVRNKVYGKGGEQADYRYAVEELYTIRRSTLTVLVEELMKRKRSVWKRGASLMLVAVFLLAGGTAAHALPLQDGDPLTNAQARGAGGTSFSGYQTHYEFKADELGGEFQTSFCVDPRHINNNSTWTIDFDFSGVDVKAAKLGAYYFSGAGTQYTRSVFQVAIWSLYNPTIGSNHANFLNVAGLLADETWKNLSTSGFAIARSTLGQDQLVQVPEPGTMLLLGVGLIGLAAFGRRKFAKA